MSTPDRTVQVTTPSDTEIRITRDFAFRFPLQEARDAMLAAGMSEGIGASFAGLETLLAEEALT